MNQRFLLACAIPVVMFLGGCSGGAHKLLHKANKKFAQGEYEDAIQNYKMAMDKGAPKDKANYLIGESYRLSNRSSEAASFYQAAIQAGVKEDKAPFYLAQGLKAKGQYMDAKAQYSKYAESGTNENLVKIAEVEARNMDKIMEMQGKKSLYSVDVPKENINTEGAEFSPVVVGDKMYYTASNNQFKYGANGTGFTDIYEYKYDGTSAGSGSVKEVSSRVNMNRTHEAFATVSPDGSYMIFARSNDGSKKGATDTDLFITRKKDGEWSEPEKLPISDPNAWESTPFVAPDGKTLYFSSNRKGGEGGNDIYKATIEGNGERFSNVTNMGKAINTHGNEMAPYIGPTGKFFFSSDGHAGLGALDILEVKNLSNPVAVNLSAPVNSSGDDFGIFFTDSLHGYLSSNRPGGKGDDDIYSFTKRTPPPPKKYKYMLSLTVQSEDPKTKAVGPVDKAHVKFDDEKGARLSEAMTDASGKLYSELDSTRSKYLLVIDREGYFSYLDKFSMEGRKPRLDSVAPDMVHKVIEETVSIKKIKLKEEIVLENIYYDYNKSDIREDAKPSLQILVDFLKENPKVKVQLGSHTDARGDDKYNLKLSQARAKSAVSYIVSQGIESGRIVPKGYGETLHVVKDAQTEEDHQLNRRTEFKVIDIAKDPAPAKSKSAGKGKTKKK